MYSTYDFRALKSFFTALENDENRGVNLTRGLACEYVAWQFLTHLTGRESIKYLLYELPAKAIEAYHDDEESAVLQTGSSVETSLPVDSSIEPHGATVSQEPTTENGAGRRPLDSQYEEFAMSFQNLNALEIAAVSDAKKFLSQRVVQRIIEAIWRGDIVFWSTLDIHSEKEAEIYNKKYITLLMNTSLANVLLVGRQILFADCVFPVISRLWKHCSLSHFWQSISPS
jgi:hypothetical protein